MNSIKINTKELSQKIIKISSLIDDLDSTLDKIDTKIKSLSYENSTWYSSTTVSLYDHYLENASKIKQLQNSYKQYFQSIDNVIEEYENLESDIIEKTENISSIKII